MLTKHKIWLGAGVLAAAVGVVIGRAGDGLFTWKAGHSSLSTDSAESGETGEVGGIDERVSRGESGEQGGTRENWRAQLAPRPR
jgi:hypothetical protein